jgi:hypothetical protein
MNTDTGHVFDISKLSDEERKRLATLGYEPVPPQLEAAAAAVIEDGGQATRARHPQISRWAKHRRKARRRMERLTRRKNRQR